MGPVHAAGARASRLKLAAKHNSQAVSQEREFTTTSTAKLHESPRADYVSASGRDYAADSVGRSFTGLSPISDCAAVLKGTTL